MLQHHTRVNVHERERDMPKLHTSEHRLSRLYTWPQQGKAMEKTQKIRCKCTAIAPGYLTFPLSSGDKNHPGDGYKRGGKAGEAKG